MLPNPRPANIPGLFQFPPSLEPRLASYDDHSPQRPPPHFSSSSRLPVGTDPGAMRHNHPTSYQFPHPVYTPTQHAQTPDAVRVPASSTPSAYPPYIAPAPHTHTQDSPRDPASPPPPTTSYAAHAQQQQYVQHSNYAPALPSSSRDVPPSHHPHHAHAPHHWAPQPHPPASESAVTHGYAHEHISVPGPVPVKCEEEPDSAMWAEDTPASSAYDASPQYLQEQSYSPQYVDEPEMIQSPVDAPMHDCKQERVDQDFVEQPYAMQYANDGATHNWGNAPGFYPPQPPDYYPTTPSPEPSDSSSGMYVAYPHPYSPGMFVDSPESHDAAFPVIMPDAYVPSLHSVRPLPVGPTRSYTLEGAITPVSPKPRPAPRSASTLPAKRKSSSPPPMGSLRPPASRIQSQTQTQTQTSEPPAAAPASVLSPQPQSQPSASGSNSGSSSSPAAEPSAQKRPRGRPRKNPSSISTDSADGQVIPPPPSVPVPVPVVNPAPAPPPTLDGPTAGQAMFKLDMAVANGEGPDGGKEPEKKKPIMACLFCRERKIACGPPAPGGPQRCNQCTRRGLTCEYPKESRRGQHKRGARAAKVEAHAASSASGSVSPPLGGSDKPATKGKAKPKVDTKNLPRLEPGSSSQGQVQSAVDVLMRSSSPLTPIPSPSVAARSLPNSPARLPVPAAAIGGRAPSSLSAQSSPANTLRSPTHPPPVPAVGVAVERKSRPEKVELMREGKERSRSRPREQPLGDVQIVAARRAAQRQMQAQAQAKRRASVEEQAAAGIVRLQVGGMAMGVIAPPGAFAGHPQVVAGVSHQMHPQGMRG